MENEKVVWVKCVISRGGFATERMFEIRLKAGKFTGIASVDYCFDKTRKPLKVEEMDFDEEMDGYVIGILRAKKSPQMSVVYLPDGEIYEIPNGLVEERENRNVPVES